MICINIQARKCQTNRFGTLFVSVFLRNNLDKPYVWYYRANQEWQ